MPDFSQRFRRSKKGAMGPAASPVSAPPLRETQPTDDRRRLLVRHPRPSPSQPRQRRRDRATARRAPPAFTRPNPHFATSSSVRRTSERAPAPASLAQPSSPAIVNHGPAGESDPKDRTAGQSDVAQASKQGGGPGDMLHKIPAFLNLSRDHLDGGERTMLGTQDPVAHPQYAPLSPMYRNLDRYGNVQPWNSNRIKLQVPEGATDYINASPIILKSPLNPDDRPPHRYIAMQGPKGNTTEHTWRMVAEQLQSPAVIVMLTETHEKHIEKCFPYYPRDVDETKELGEADEFGDGFRASLKCVSVEEKAEGAIVMRQLVLHVEGRDEDMVVWHLLYKKWPDYGVPALEDIESFFELMRLSRAKNASQDNPRIVHCSAGVGRSGTFIALEHLMREVDSGDLENYDEKHGGADAPDLVFDTVNTLREQRRMMVQAEPQFLFIYQVLRKQWMEKYNVVEEDDEPASKRLEVAHDPFVED
ncbi:hypothetical protein PG994_008720 [Apiospora phragmitis]|uniref:Uncharacterized protein n=1 Tax=Apiospora phragmitis TaxID=2905665 RepID=A0ABR1UH99_9PEZI